MTDEETLKRLAEIHFGQRTSGVLLLVLFLSGCGSAQCEYSVEALKAYEECVQREDCKITPEDLLSRDRHRRIVQQCQGGRE